MSGGRGIERWAPWISLALLLAVAGVFVLWQTRGTYFWYDEWIWIRERRELTAATFLEPHNQHLSLIPVAIYRFLFATLGLDYWPYRGALAVSHLACGLAVFLYARPRVGTVLGIAAAALILFLGAGWANVLWPFQMAWLISVAAGVGALLALDRRERRTDVVAALLLGVSLASSGVGIPFVVAAAVDVALERRRWSAGLILAAPLAVYLAWWLAYQTSGPPQHLPALDVPLYLLRSACAALLGVFSLLRSGAPLEETPDVPLLLGVPLLIAAMALAAWRLHRLGRVPPRVLALLAGALTFWVSVAVQRGAAAPPATSRYVFVGSLFVVLLAVELARGASIRPRVAAALATVALAVVVADVPLFDDAAAGLRADAEETRIAIGVFEIAGDSAPPGEPLTILPGYPLVVVSAGDYFAASRAWGPFRAGPPGEIAAASLADRLAVDRQFLRIDSVTIDLVAWAEPPGSPPRVDASEGGRVTRAGACVRFAALASDSAAIDFTVPPGGLLVRARGGGATISLRRFTPFFIPEPAAKLPAGASVRVRVTPDSAQLPWHARVMPRRGATVCPA